MKDISQYIDHTLLKPDSTLLDIENLCREAEAYNFASVCISPIYAETAVKLLDNTPVKVGSVAGFPVGYTHTSNKVDELKTLLDIGVDEVDVVINLAHVKNKNWSAVRSEMDSLATTIALRHQKILKLIFETALLEPEEVIYLCNLCTEYDVDYAKTSTGFSSRGASLEDIRLMKEHLGKEVKIKASGGIKNYIQASSFIEAGASRIGTSSGVQIINSQ